MKDGTPISTDDRLYRLLVEQVAASDLPSPDPSPDVVTDDDLAELPEAVRRYLRFMQVIGQTRDRSLCARFVGRFRLRGRLGWMPAVAWQYNTSPDIARIYVMRLRLAGIIPMIGRDTYHHGHGRMIGKILDRWTIVDSQGDAFDRSELVTYLNDAVLLAPSMLLTPATTWTGIDPQTFDISLTDHDLQVTGRVHINTDGAPQIFSTNDRYADLPNGPIRTPWRTPITSWTTTNNGRPIPAETSAIWDLPDGPFIYATGHFTLEEPTALARHAAPHPAACRRSSTHHPATTACRAPSTRCSSPTHV